AYVSAFGSKALPIFDGKSLNPANLGFLEAVRNLFAHRNGRSDEPFRILVGKYPASDYYYLRDLEDGKRVEVTATMVRDLWQSTCATALALIVIVNERVKTA